MAISSYWHDSTDTIRHARTESNWNEARKGLAMSIVGYACLLGGWAFGAGLFWLLHYSQRRAWVQELVGRDEETVLLMAVASLIMAVLAGYGLLIAGLWRCLTYVPQHQGAKEQVYVCITFFLVGSLLNIASAFLGGWKNYERLFEGVDGFHKLDYTSSGGIMQLTGVVLCLFTFYVFNQFLRTIVCCFDDRPRIRVLDLYLMYMSLLIGGTVTSFFVLRRLPFHDDVFRGLAIGWIVCLVLQTCVIQSIRNGIKHGMGKLGVTRPGDETGITLQNVSQRLSGMHRILRAMEKQRGEAR